MSSEPNTKRPNRTSETMGKGTMRLGLISFLAIATLLSGCWGSGDATDKASRDAAFKEVLGFDAPASVGDVKSSWYFMRDSYVCWLRFSCDDATISKILSLDGSKLSKFSSTHDAPGRSEQNPNAPAWWTDVQVGSDLEELEIDRSKSSESDITSIWIDKKSRIVYAARNVFH